MSWIPDRNRHAPRTWREPVSHFGSLLADPWFRVVLGCYDVLLRSTVEFWHERSVGYLPVPMTTGSVSSPVEPGSDSEPVEVVLNGMNTYLVDSAQFLLEVGCRLAGSGCYYFMPSFRGDSPDSSHLSQFMHSEAELPIDLESVMDVVEDYVRFISNRLIDEAGESISTVTRGDLAHLEAAAEFSPRRVEYQSACRALDSVAGALSETTEGFTRMTRLGEQAMIDLHGGFVWVTHMEHRSVPFYQAFDDENPDWAKNADLLLGIGEVAGAGQRHQTAAQVRRALALHGLSGDDYEWYVAMREGEPRLTSGFGLGVERFLLFALQHNDIRDVPLFLRVPGVPVYP